MDKDYVKAYLRLETTHWWFLIRQKIIVQTIGRFVKAKPLNTPPLKILNIGVAGGFSSKWLLPFGEVCSVENDPMFLEYLLAQKIPVTNASITSLPYADNSFDLVCAFDVIEHVDIDEKAAQELERVCKSQGKICITVPAFQALWGSHDEANGHYRRYTQKQLLHAIQKTGNTEMLYCTYFNSLLFIPLFLFRKISAIFKKPTKKSKVDFDNFTSNGIVNKVLQIIFGIEPFLLKWIKFSFGVSLLMLVEKIDSPQINK